MRFAVFDIDGTLIRWQLYHAIADALAKENLISKADYEAIRQAHMVWKRRQHKESFKAYELELVQRYERALTQLPVEQFNAAAQAVFEEYKDQIYTYTRDLIQQLKAAGYLLFAVSGSQQEIIAKIAEYYGFDDCVGSVYHQTDGRFTGTADLPLGKKDQVVKVLVSKHQATWQGSIGVGDSFGDIAMLELTERPIAFNPEQSLLEHAKQQGWEIVIERKNVVYQLEPRDGQYHLK